MKNDRSINAINIPRIQLPGSGNPVMPGDGNFSANAFTGAATFTLPIPLPSARALTPSLSVTYDSGSGNGLMGMGFQLSESAVAVKTNRAVAQYTGADIYTLDDAELVFHETQHGRIGNKDAVIDTWLERWQSAFPLIQRISTADGVYWQVTGSDNSVSIYGDSENSRICDPGHPGNIYKWLLTAVSDTQGNTIRYDYTRFTPGDANTYLTSIAYGNYRDRQQTDRYAFNVVLDYGQWDLQTTGAQLVYDPQSRPHPPAKRRDILCHCRPGFLLRTEYLLRNILVIHQLDGDPQTQDGYCTQWTRFSYNDVKGAQAVTTLSTITTARLLRIGENTYRYKAAPAIGLDFIPWAEDQQLSFSTITDEKGNFIDRPLQLVDLYQQGLPGILYRDAETLIYSEALGDGVYRSSQQALTAPVGFTDPHQPMNIVSLEGDGILQLQLDQQQYSGYYPRDEQYEWKSFVAFERRWLDDLPHRTANLDLTGSSRTDSLRITPDTLYFHASLGLQGMSGQPVELRNATGVEEANAEDIEPKIFYGWEDLFGDGLQHRVKIEDGRLSCWPNLGYGRFGEMLTVAVPGLDLADEAMHVYGRLALADVNGSGLPDIVLVYRDRIRIFFNFGGLAFSEAVDLAFPEGFSWSDADSIRFADVAGNGNPCLVFSRMGPHVFNGEYRDSAHYFYEFNGTASAAPSASVAPGKGACNKPFLLRRLANNRGVDTAITYRSSIRDYLRDNQQDPWYTHLPFPVIVTASSTVTDRINRMAQTTAYAYRNGYFDPVEHSFMGFGCVERTETAVDVSGAATAGMPITLTRQWFHIGSGLSPEAWSKEFFNGGADFANCPFVESSTDADLTILAGKPLHCEVYDKKNSTPYTADCTSYIVIRVQDATPASKAVYRSHPCQTLGFDYEQRADDPMVHQQLILEVDEFDHVLKTFSLAYPRKKPLLPEQSRYFCTSAQTRIANQTTQDLPRHLGIPLETSSYEVTGLPFPAKTWFTCSEFQLLVAGGSLKTSLLDWQTNHYWSDERQQAEWIPGTPLPSILLAKYRQSAEFDTAQLQDIGGGKLADADIIAAGYVKGTGNDYWWKRSNVLHYGQEADFFLLTKTSWDWAGKGSSLYTESGVGYDDYGLAPLSSYQRLSDTVIIQTVAKTDYRVMQAWQVTDINGNTSEAVFDEWGMVIAGSTYEKGGINGDAPISRFTALTPATAGDVLADPLKFLQGAGSYTWFQWGTGAGDDWSPAVLLTLVRTKYRPTDPSEIATTLTYSDGLGRTLETKRPADHDAAGKPQWTSSGRTRWQMNGLPWLSYFGYFSDTPDYQADDTGIQAKDLPVPTRYQYDALNREQRVITPKGNFTAVLVLNAWETQHFGDNDTILESDYYKSGLWKNDPQEKDAVDKAAACYNTPSATIADALGRTISVIADNGNHADTPIDWEKTRLAAADIDPTADGLLVSVRTYDIRGRVLTETDARFHAGNRLPGAGKQRSNVETKYPLGEGIAFSTSPDSGSICSLDTVHGDCSIEWDELGVKHVYAYDNLQRQLSHTVYTGGGHEPATSLVIAVFIYGESQPQALQNNMLGKVWKLYDGAGLSVISAYTFDGHPVDQTVRFRVEYKTEADWQAAHLADADRLLEPETFVTRTQFDAAGRPVRQVMPDGTVNEWTFGLMGNCTGSRSDIKGLANPRTVLKNSAIDANGAISGIQYGNGVVTTLQYDPLTLELSALKSMAAGSVLQDLQCWYDPGGHVTRLQNNLADVVFSRNQKVNPLFDYTYDAIGRLQKAMARCLVHNGGNNLQSAENYTELYQYDKGYNLSQVQRICTQGYTRTYTVAGDSNRLTGYQQGNAKEQIGYNDAGYMLNSSGAGTAALQWNVLGNISAAVLIERTGGANDADYYVYSNGVRMRTVSERYDATGKMTDRTDKHYLGDYRRTDSRNGDALHSITMGGAQAQDAVLQYGTTKVAPGIGDPVCRYQHSSEVTVMSMETNELAAVITYEEYSPYGDTVYWFDPAHLGSTKEYKYNRKEMDAATGLYYYGLRYYAPWLYRWTRPDPAGTIDGLNFYAYVHDEPIGNTDARGLVKQPPSKKSRPPSQKKQAQMKHRDDLNAKYSSISSSLKEKRITRQSPQEELDLVNLRMEMVDAEAAVEQREGGGGGQKPHYDDLIVEIHALLMTHEEKITELFSRMSRERTLTRYGFAVEWKSQGPHTNARVNVLEMNQGKIKASMSAEDIHEEVYKSDIYLRHELEDLEQPPSGPEGDGLRAYIDHYSAIRDRYDTARANNDVLGVIAHGQSLLDLHPYGTSRGLATGGDRAGKGERRNQDDPEKLYDYPRRHRYAGGSKFKRHIKGMIRHIKGFVARYFTWRGKKFKNVYVKLV